MTLTQLWYTTNHPQEELGRLLTSTCLKDAVGILQSQAKPKSIKTADPVSLALTHAQLVGYQRAIEDLLALAAPRNMKQLAALPAEWSRIPTQQPE